MIMILDNMSCVVVIARYQSDLDLGSRRVGLGAAAAAPAGSLTLSQPLSGARQRIVSRLQSLQSPWVHLQRRRRGVRNLRFRLQKPRRPLQQQPHRCRSSSPLETQESESSSSGA